MVVSVIKWWKVGDDMFIGEYIHSLDSKKRIIMPVKFREELGDKFIITKGLDGCLTVYTTEKWKEVLSKLEQLPNTKKEIRLYIRGLTSKATECECDAQGRIQLPSFLIQEASLEKQCVFVGVSNKVEIWSKEKWESYYAEASDSFDEIAETITDYLQ